MGFLHKVNCDWCLETGKSFREKSIESEVEALFAYNACSAFTDLFVQF